MSRTKPVQLWNRAGQGGKRKASAEADASGLPLKRSHVERQACGTAPKRAVASSSDVPENITDIQGLLSWIHDVARAAEVPQENPSSPALGCLTAENPGDSKELSRQAATGISNDPFWGLPPSPGFLPELQCGLSEQRPVVPPASALLSPRPTTLAVSAPPSVPTTQPTEEVQQRQPQEAQAPSPPSAGSVPSRVAVKNRGSSKRGAKRPAPAATSKERESSQQEQPTNSAPAKKRKLPPCRERTQRRGRQQPCQRKRSGAGAGARGSQAGPASELRKHLHQSIQAVHPLGQKVTAVGPVRQPPSMQLQPSASAGPAALQPQDSHALKAEAAAPGSTVQEEGAAKEVRPSCPRPSPQRSSALRRVPPPPPPPPALHQQQPRPRRPVDVVPCRAPQAGGGAIPAVLEESLPITAGQRLERERMKQLAQEERQRAAQHMKIGPVQFLVQREIDMAIADHYGYL